MTIDPRAIPDDVLAVCRRLRDAGHEAHLVGGGIRDLLRGRPPKDFDVATSARPDAVMALFGTRFAIPTGLQHGTVTVLAGTAESPRPVEVTTFRTEGQYLDGRRPSTVKFGTTLAEDLARRDFTMNAIAYDPLTGTTIDPWGGRADLGRRLVRAVGDPEERFREDGLRAMRAVRQAAQLGFAIDEPTLAAIPRALDSFRKVSAERVRDELFKLLLAPRPSAGLELMREAGLLAEVLPELMPAIGCAQNQHHRFDVYRHTLETVDHAAPGLTVRLGALLHDVGKPATRTPKEGAPGEYSFWKHEHLGAEMAQGICQRLRASNAERDDVVALVENHMFFYTPEWTDGTVRRFVRRVGRERLPGLLELRKADIDGRGRGEDRDKETRELEARIERVAAEDAALKVSDLAIGGHDVMRVLGIPAGPRVGRVLDALLERVLDDPALNTREALERLALTVGTKAGGDSVLK